MYTNLPMTTNKIHFLFVDIRIISIIRRLVFIGMKAT